jgi:hypothetical protein
MIILCAGLCSTIRPFAGVMWMSRYICRPQPSACMRAGVSRGLERLAMTIQTACFSPTLVGDSPVMAHAPIHAVSTRTLICALNAGPNRMASLNVPSCPNRAKLLKLTVKSKARIGPFLTSEPLVAPLALPTKYGGVSRTIDSRHFDDIVTPLLWRRLLFWLEGHDPCTTSYLVNGFRYSTTAWNQLQATM